MLKLIKFLLFLIILSALAIAGAAYWLGNEYWQTAGPITEDTIVEIQQGQGFRQIVYQLEQENIFGNGQVILDQPTGPWLFIGTEMLNKRQMDYRAGEYLIPAKSTPKQVSEILRTGQPYQRKVTLVEGMTSLQFVNMAKELPGLAGPWPVVPEGTLLPDTYYYTKNEGATALVNRMQIAMRDTVNELWQNRAKDLPITSKAEAVILASIVEKETGIAKERPLVASVFLNRLRVKMPMQSDPTTIYGLSNGLGKLDRELTRADLKKPTPYNTYTIPALPPGAIANPGKDAIKAVLQPVKSNYYYFVADGTGGHKFAKNLAEHNKNVVNWRRLGKLSGVEDAVDDGPAAEVPSPSKSLLGVIGPGDKE